MKKLILLPLLFVCASAHAVPNIWTMGFWGGYAEYSIQDSDERALWIACESGAGEDYDHSARFEMNNKTYKNSDSEHPLTFLLDGKKSVTPPASTSSHSGDSAWNDFTDGMSKARKIDVYLNNKKITTFTPIKSSIDEVAKGMADCKGKLSQ